jgi:hypothetical protein
VRAILAAVPIRRLAIILLALAGLWALVWSLQAEPLEPLEQLPLGAPVVLCERVEDPELETPVAASSWFGDLGVPMPPAGSFAGHMHPRLFRELGFAPGTQVCAAAVVPDLDTIQEQAKSAGAVYGSDRKLQALLGGCGCTIVKAKNLLHMAPRCVKAPVRDDCTDKPDRVAQIEAAVGELEAALRAERPRLHWRVVGTLGREGRFAVKAPERLEWLDYPGMVFTPDNRSQAGRADPLAQQMLGEAHVVAVVSQGQGRAILVVREIDELLVFDYFEQLADPKRWGASWPSLDVDFLGERASLALALPGDAAQSASVLLGNSGKDGESPLTRQGFIHLEHGRIDDLDRLLLGARRGAGFDYDEAQEKRQLEELVADTLTLQWEPGRVRGRYGLTPAGQQWWGQPLAGDTVIAHAAALAPRKVEGRFEAALPHDFILRGSALETGLFDALRGFPQVVDAIFAVDATAIRGSGSQFTIELAPGQVVPGLGTAAGLQGLRTHLSMHRHELEVRVDVDRAVAEFALHEP